ncbi:hypothetical protein FLA_6096 [Filimonas lacunae]|nr:hypothetical protein FLA_6096 [Filimonas lacunae]
MKERNAELQNKLLEGVNGWKGFLRTSAAGSGYGFYMNFNSVGEVVMYADWNNDAAITAKNSTYRILYVMNTQLSFDTYNYISIMQDPQTSVNGGTTGNGLQSDIEFEYIRSSADTVILRGKKYKNYLYMMKASASEAAQYNNGEYKTAIANFNTFFTTHNNNYILVNAEGSDLKVGFSIAGKIATAQVKKADNSIASDTRGFGYSIDGIYFTDAIQILGVKIIALKLKDANTLVAIDDSGKEYAVLQNPTPLADFVDMFGSTKTYNSIYCYGTAYPSTAVATLPTGVTSNYNSEFSGLISRFSSTSRYVDTVEFRLSNSTTALVRIWYWSGSTHYLADASFTYTYADNTITLTNYTPSVSNTNWTTRITQIGSFLTWLQSGPFKADWVVSSTPSSPTLGGLYKTSNASDFMYGRMRKQ